MTIRQLCAAAALAATFALATPAHARDRDPVVARDDRRRTTTSSSSSPTISTPRKPNTRSCRPSRAATRYDECRHRRIPCRQCAAHHAGVRGRHRDHDGAKGAIKPVYQLMKERASRSIPRPICRPSPATTRPRRARCCRFPSTRRAWCCGSISDALKEAGIAEPPKTWPDVFADAKKLHATHATCGFSTAWITWGLIEQFSAWHNVPIGTKANGLDGFDTVLEFNSPLQPSCWRTWSTCRRTRATIIPAAPTPARGASPRANARCS